VLLKKLAQMTGVVLYTKKSGGKRAKSSRLMKIM
jgi:hypothetical protein